MALKSYSFIIIIVIIIIIHNKQPMSSDDQLATQPYKPDDL